MCFWSRKMGDVDTNHMEKVKGLSVSFTRALAALNLSLSTPSVSLHHTAVTGLICTNTNLWWRKKQGRLRIMIRNTWKVSRSYQLPSQTTEELYSAGSDRQWMHIELWKNKLHAASSVVTDSCSLPPPAKERKFAGGSGQISEGMANELGDRVKLESPVYRIDQTGDMVVVETVNKQTYTVSGPQHFHCTMQPNSNHLTLRKDSFKISAHFDWKV